MPFVRANGISVHYDLSGPAGAETLEAEQTLVSIGFKPNSENLGLEALALYVPPPPPPPPAPAQ